jgi:hypothetical protein
MLATMAEKLKEHSPNPSALGPTIKQVDRILEEARAMAPVRFERQRELLLQRMIQIVAAGMRGEGASVRR